MNTSLPYQFSEPHARLRKARLYNISLVPASLLPLKGTYQNVANSYPIGSVLCISGTAKQQKIIATITQFFRDHGRSVITMPIEKITSTMKKAPRTHAENLPLYF